MKMVVTTYDEHRQNLRKMIEEALEYARVNLMDPKVWGYDQMRDGYGLEVFTAINTARTSI